MAGLSTGTAGPVAVVGGNGLTGRSVRAALTARGRTSRSVGRADWPRLSTVMDGCAAVYLIAPNMHPDEPALVAEVLTAAEAAGVDTIVYHSVAAPYCPSMPHHLGKARSEDLIRRSALAWTILQPCAYLQNLTVGLDRELTAIRVPYDVTRPFGLVDLHDVAEAAATVLEEDGHGGATYELGGAELVSVADVARVAGAVYARTVRAVRIDTATWLGEAPALPEYARATFLAMWDYYDRHGLPAGGVPLGALLRRPPTDLAAGLRRELG